MEVLCSGHGCRNKHLSLIQGDSAGDSWQAWGQGALEGTTDPSAALADGTLGILPESSFLPTSLQSLAGIGNIFSAQQRHCGWCGRSGRMGPRYQASLPVSRNNVSCFIHHESFEFTIWGINDIRLWVQGDQTEGLGSVYPCPHCCEPGTCPGKGG